MPTPEEQELYNGRLEKYQGEIDRLVSREETILLLAKQDDVTAAYKYLVLAEDMLCLATMHLAKHKLSLAIIKSKNEVSLNDARKALYKSIIYLENIVTDFIDAPFSDYKDKVEIIKGKVGDKENYNIVFAMGKDISFKKRS